MVEYVTMAAAVTSVYVLTSTLDRAVKQVSIEPVTDDQLITNNNNKILYNVNGNQKHLDYILISVDKITVL